MTMAIENSTFEGRFLALIERLPQPVMTHLTKIASRNSYSALDEGESNANITVERFEFVYLIVDKSFASVKPKWEVAPGVYYVADSLYFIEYYIEIANDTDPQTVTLTDNWIKKMAWGVGNDVSKSYYLLYNYTNIPEAGLGNYNPSTGVLSITFDPEEGPTEYWIDFIFLAKKGFVNQFISKPSISQDLSPKTTPPLKTGTFYNMWLNMKNFKVSGIPLEVYVYMEIPEWQSTENGVYIKNMDPQTVISGWWGADPPDVPGPTYGSSSWVYPNVMYPIPLIDPAFPNHWIQFSFEKSDVPPSSGHSLYRGSVEIIYSNTGVGIVTGKTPQLTLSPEDWDISVSTGLGNTVTSILDYYFEEPSLNIIGGT
jgi:hypothetical protein